MRIPWLWLLFFLFWLVAAYFLCSFLIHPPIAADACGGWEVKDGRNFNYENSNDIHFRKNRAAHLAGYTGVDQGMNKIAKYLKANAQRGLTITGLYDDDENYSNPLGMNLGKARANDIKNWLINLGVSSQQLDTKSEERELSCFRNDTLRRGAMLAFAPIADNSTRIADIKSRLFGKPVTLYFNTGSDTPNINEQQQADFQDLFYYLDKVPGAKLDVHGHTDNAGNLAANVTLSQNRANDIKNYIMTNGGVIASKMDTNGFGPNAPIAPNDTPANMALNRRVEVTLK